MSRSAALLTALMLVSNTMTTLVGEQTGEIRRLIS